MFTGLVEEVGVVESVDELTDLRRFWVRASAVLENLAIGDSLSHAGCCLTVTQIDLPRGRYCVELVSETLARTHLGAVVAGSRLNLERALSVGDRLGGHIVQGHVDTVGRVLVAGSALRVGVSPGGERFLVEKGSIAVDGVSLTVAEVGDNEFAVALIPHTLEATTLGELAVGDLVNLEYDVIAKHVQRLVAPYS